MVTDALDSDLKQSIPIIVVTFVGFEAALKNQSMISQGEPPPSRLMAEFDSARLP